jgi:hypothetical protein
VYTDDLLQQCLEDVAAGRKTPEQCATQYPQEDDLLGQLVTAQAFMHLAPPQLSAAAVRRHQSQLRAAVSAQRVQARRPLLGFAFPRWAVAAVLVVAVLASGLGTVSASASSLPGQALYPVKRAAEAVQTSLVPAARQAGWHASLADRRTDELVALAERPQADASLLPVTAAEVGAETAVALAHVALAPAGEQAELLAQLLAQIDRQQAILAQVHDQVPAQAQASIDQAMAVSAAHHDAALQQLEQVNHEPGTPLASSTPTRTAQAANTTLPPGQAKKTATATSVAATNLPPGQAKKTATAAVGGTTDLPPGQARKTATPTQGLPPGHANQTATAAAQGTAGPTATPPGNANNPTPQPTPNCSANNPNSPQYCTPTPAPVGSVDSTTLTEAATSIPPIDNPPPTACPLNPAGNPVCSNRP